MATDMSGFNVSMQWPSVFLFGNTFVLILRKPLNEKKSNSWWFHTPWGSLMCSKIFQDHRCLKVANLFCQEISPINFPIKLLRFSWMSFSKPWTHALLKTSDHPAPSQHIGMRLDTLLIANKSVGLDPQFPRKKNCEEWHLYATLFSIVCHCHTISLMVLKRKMDASVPNILRAYLVKHILAYNVTNMRHRVP